MGSPSLRVVAIAVVALPCAVAGTYLVRNRATHGAAEASVILEPSPVEPSEPVADWCAPGFEVFDVRDAGAESSGADEDASTPPASTTPLVPPAPDDASGPPPSPPPADE
jgi:hypothetical protein